MVFSRDSLKPASAQFLLTKPAFGQTLRVLLDRSWTSLRALTQLLLGTTLIFLRFVVTIPAAITGMARAGERQPYMVGVAVEWEDEAGNGSGYKRTLMPAPTLLNSVIVMSAMKSFHQLNANKCGRTIMTITSIPLPIPPTRCPSPKQLF